MKNYKIISVIFFISLFTFGQTPKIYDPMDVFRQHVPANILVVVDNSGSMAQDTSNSSISTTSYINSVFPSRIGTISTNRGKIYVNKPSLFGTTWAYNEPSHAGYYYAGPAQSSSIFTNRTSTFEVHLSDNGKLIDFLSLDILFDDIDEGRDALQYITSIEITHPSGRKIELLDKTGPINDKIYYNYRDYSSTVGRYLQHKFLRVALGGAPVDDPTATEAEKFFRGLPAGDNSENYKITIKHSSTYGGYIRAIRIGTDPKLSKFTVMKSVLQDIFRQNDKARFAFGAYKTVWKNEYTEVLPDRTSHSVYAHAYNSNIQGAEILENFPSDPLDTTSNKANIIDWVNMDMGDLSQWESSSNPRGKEIGAFTYTPIGYTFRDMQPEITNMLNNDPSKDCRNYAVIFLTDGYCTAGSCDLTYVTREIEKVYNLHKVKDDNGNNIGIRSYIIGFAMGTNSSTLNSYAAAGQTDGNPNIAGSQAYMPDDAVSLKQAFEDAIASAGEMAFTGDTQLIPIQLDPDKQAKVDENGDDYLFQGEDNQENTLIQSFFSFSIGNDFGVSNISFKGHLRAYSILKDDYSLLDNGTYRPLWDVSNYTETLRDKNGTAILENGEEKKVERRGTINQRIDNIKPLLTADPTKANNLGSTGTKVEFRKSFRCIITPNSVTGSVSLVYLNDYSYSDSLNRYTSNNISFVKSRCGFTTDQEASNFIDFLQKLPMGDITSSTPAIVGAPDSYYSDADYTSFAEANANRQKVVYIGANDGMLHCLDAHTGDELWAYIPYDIFPKLRELYEQGQPNPTGNLDPIGRKPHLYYMSSSPRYTDIKTGTNSWRTILTVGRGGGGNSYTTLNITNPSIYGFDEAHFYQATEETNPSQIALGYKIANDSSLFMWNTFADSTFNNMGETWSVPAFVRIGEINFIGFFGSGYDATNSGKGNYFYIINLYDGTAVQNPMQLPTNDSEAVIMASPGALLGAGGEFFSVYFGDTKGGLYRYIPNFTNFSESTLDRIFQGNSSTHNTNIFGTPSAFLNAQGEVWLTFGTVGTESSTNVVENSVLYTVKDPGYGDHTTILNDGDLINLKSAITNTNTLYEAATVLDTNGDGEVDKAGHYYPLDDRESIFSSSITTGYNLNGSGKFYLSSLFLTFQYPEIGNYCTLGSTYLYIFGMTNLFIADEDDNGDGKSYIGEGKPGAPFESTMGDIWVNTQKGPIRFTNTQGEGVQMGSGALPVDATLLGRDGGWYTK